MSNHSNNILDGEELIQNSPPFITFSPRWEKIEKVFYISFRIFFIVMFFILFRFYLDVVAPNPTERDDKLMVIISLFLAITLLSPVIYIWQFKKFRRYHNSLSENTDRRLIFLIITPVVLLVAIVLLLISATLLFLAFYFVSDTYMYEPWMNYSFVLLVPLTVLSAFLNAYYIYSTRFIYRINDTPIDSILN